MFSTQHFKLVIVAFVAMYSATASSDDSFYKTREKGWFWYETNPEPEPEPKVIPPQLPINKPSETNQEKMVEINAEWLKANLPELKMKAINSPTKENLGAFFAAQRLMLDMASRFSDKSSEYFRTSGNFLSEEHRRPTESYMLSKFKRDREVQAKPVLEKIGMKGGLWFFYSSTCPYCAKQLPIMKALANVFKVEVLYVSLDGGLLPGIPKDKVVFDTSGKAAADFNIQVTPTTVLVSKNADTFKVISLGAASLTKLQTHIVENAHSMKWITDEEFQSAQHIRGTNTLENGNLSINESDVKNTSILSEILENKIDLSSSPIGTPFRRGK